MVDTILSPFHSMTDYLSSIYAQDRCENFYIIAYSTKVHQLRYMLLKLLSFQIFKEKIFHLHLTPRATGIRGKVDFSLQYFTEPSFILAEFQHLPQTYSTHWTKKGVGGWQPTQ